MADAVTPSTTEGPSIVAAIDTPTPAPFPLTPVTPEVSVAPQKAADPKVDAPKPEEKPIEYTDFKVPDGFEADADVMTEFKTASKALKLTQEQAQQFVDLQTRLAAKQAKTAQDSWASVQKDWRTKAESDTEFGGKDFKANVGIAKKALDQFGSKEFKEAIETTGMGNHPELIRFLYKVGKAISEDKIMTGGNSNTGPRDLAKILFPNQN